MSRIAHGCANPISPSSREQVTLFNPCVQRRTSDISLRFNEILWLLRFNRLDQSPDVETRPERMAFQEPPARGFVFQEGVDGALHFEIAAARAANPFCPHFGW